MCCNKRKKILYTNFSIYSAQNAGGIWRSFAALMQIANRHSHLITVERQKPIKWSSTWM